MSSTRDLLHANDLRFVEFARGLSDAEWAQPSLCAQWTNHEVLAHLVMGYGASATAFSKAMIRHRGSFDRANAALAADLARRCTPSELIDQFVALENRPRSIGRIFPKRLLLGDHVIHELDIAFALGQESTVASEALVNVLNTQVGVPNPFIPAAARARGLNLRASDVDWAHGTGDLTVSGAAAHLASVLAGRMWAFAQLSGSGVEALRDRIIGPSQHPSGR